MIMGLVLLITPVSLYPFLQTNELPVTYANYNIIKRLAWVAGMSWLILTCATFDKNSEDIII